MTPADLDFGPGVTVRRIVSSTPSEVVAEVDVASDAALGKRDVRFRHSVLPGAVAIYDRVDYIKVVPESALAAFGDQAHARGYQQFEAIGYQRGPDGKAAHRRRCGARSLGPNDVAWSIEVFYAAPGSSTDFVGKISASGFFTPAADSPNNNFDVWVVATAKSEKDKNGKPLVGKAYMVVTVPTYTLERTSVCSRSRSMGRRRTGAKMKHVFDPSDSLLLSGVPSADAHHGYAAFDTTAEVTLKGTVTDFHFTNPALRDRIRREGRQGPSAELESASLTSANHLAPKGWTELAVAARRRTRHHRLSREERRAFHVGHQDPDGQMARS